MLYPSSLPRLRSLLKLPQNAFFLGVKNPKAAHVDLATTFRSYISTGLGLFIKLEGDLAPSSVAQCCERDQSFSLL
jgi:hypothetical protein